MQLSENNGKWVAAILFVVCFIVVIISINQIIKMASPNISRDSDPITVNTNQEVTNLIQSKKMINYKSVQEIFSSSQTDAAMISSKFGFTENISNLSAAEQNEIIRLKLLEWKLIYLEEKILQLTPGDRSIFSQICLYILSGIIWAASIVGAKCLNYFTENCIISRCQKNYVSK